VIIAIDFDGTIVKHRYPEIGEPLAGAFEWIPKFKTAGATLILWTMRSDTAEGKRLTAALDFCRDNGLEFEHANENPQSWTTSPKAYADLYIDDSAFGCPLLLDKGSKRPYVDWNRVGPRVLELIRERQAFKSIYSSALGYPTRDR
jgi:hypothetical protein